MQDHAKNEAPEEEAGIRQGQNENVYVSNAWFYLTCYHPPPPHPRQPPGQIQAFGPGGGELFETALSLVVGGGINKK